MCFLGVSSSGTSGVEEAEYTKQMFYLARPHVPTTGTQADAVLLSVTSAWRQGPPSGGVGPRLPELLGAGNLGLPHGEFPWKPCQSLPPFQTRTAQHTLLSDSIRRGDSEPPARAGHLHGKGAPTRGDASRTLLMDFAAPCIGAPELAPPEKYRPFCWMNNNLFAGLGKLCFCTLRFLANSYANLRVQENLKVLGNHVKMQTQSHCETEELGHGSG